MYLSPNDSFPKAKAAALKALQLDDTLAEAPLGKHSSSGQLNYNRHIKPQLFLAVLRPVLL
jgi:hypothetical protein